MANRQRMAQLRLQRDLRELAERAWELPTVSALPLEDNIMEWHCNIVGSDSHDGIVIHLKMLFPDTYPHQPPEVVLMSKVCHPHVFGDHVCLDMLEEGQWSDSQERDAEFTGWSTCYSVFSILMQLQAFLFELGNNANKTRIACQRCECFCGHGLHRVYPPLPEPTLPPPRPPVLQNPFDSVSSISSTRDPGEEEFKGIVNRIEQYGVFVTLEDGNVGLLHRSEVPRGISFELGMSVHCKIKTREPKLSLTMLRSEEELAEMALARSPVKAIVTNVKPFGAFVDLGGISALLHRSETDLLRGQAIPWEIGESLAVRLLSAPGSKLAVTAKPLYLLPQHARTLHDGEVDLARLCCFHSKEHFSEGIMGVGASLEKEDSNGTQDKHHLTSIYDVLSYGSFKDGVRKGVWKQKFCAFLPLAIDSEHFARAQGAFQECIANLASGTIAQKTQSHGKSKQERDAEYNARLTLDEYRAMGSAVVQKAQPLSMCRPTGSTFVPDMVFEVIPKLMNSQVVLLSSGQLWRCQKALEGYFAYHHLLLHCLNAYPSLRLCLEEKMDEFHASPKAREKSSVHNMGEFLCLLSVSDKFDWDSMGVAILEEVFDRNALWILKQSPHLGDIGNSSASDQSRLKASFRATLVSLRLLMFQFAFFNLAKPTHLHEGRICTSASAQLERKDRCKGLPGPGEAEWLFDRCLEILAVDDYSGFLELVGAAPVCDTEVARWLRRSMLRSVEKGYHNPGLFHALARKAAQSKQQASADLDPEDFACDSRPKESKADKRARKRAAQLARAVTNQKQAEYQRALSWARFYCPYGYAPRQCVQMFFGKTDIDNLLSVMDKDGILQTRHHAALAGYRLLDGKTPGKLDQIAKFPVSVWLGRGCIDCRQAVVCETSGRCMPCCHKAAKEPMVARPIKGLTGVDAPTANFTAFQAMAEMRPVQFEINFEVGFDGLVADVTPLRAALSEDLTVKDKIEGGIVFSRVSRCGRKLWEKSPEQSIFPGAKLTSGWHGVTDVVFQAKIRNIDFVLLQDTMHNMTTLDDLGKLRMNRTFCKEHILEGAVITIGLEGVDYAAIKADSFVSNLIKDNLRKHLGIVVEIADPTNYVDILFSPVGNEGMSMQATIIPPTGRLLDSITAKLSSSASLGEDVIAVTSSVLSGLAAVNLRLAGVSNPKITRIRSETLASHMQEAAKQRPCRNCRGVLRLRFDAPSRFAERRAQLEDLNYDQLIQRAQLCGLGDDASSNGASPEGRKTTINHIIKSEGIIR
jgi:ubiquitin-protein ligase